MIKAIETEYSGHKFRSRLEARWAVFFDSLGIKWEYEPEGFETDAGTRLCVLQNRPGLSMDRVGGSYDAAVNDTSV